MLIVMYVFSFHVVLLGHELMYPYGRLGPKKCPKTQKQGCIGMHIGTLYLYKLYSEYELLQMVNISLYTSKIS